MNFTKFLIPVYALTLFTSGASQAEVKCPIPPTAVSPTLQSKVTFDRKSGLYLYEYSLSNSKSSSLPIEALDILTDVAPKDIAEPAHWKGEFIGESFLKKNITWRTTDLDPKDPRAKIVGYKGPPLKLHYTIKPGQSLSGFSFKSPNPPGPARYFAEGEFEVPVSMPTEGDDEPDPNCPGFFDAPRFEAMRGGVTEAPMPPDMIPISIRLLNNSGAWHSKDFNPDKGSGNIVVLVLPSHDFEPASLQLSSLRLGPGKAPVLSSKTHGNFKDREEDRGDWEKSSRRFNPEFAKADDHIRSKKGALFLVFDLKKVGLRCELDGALFLEGKTTDGKSVVGAVPIRNQGCKPHWKK